MLTINLPGTEVALIGDSHQNTEWMQNVLRSLEKSHPDAILVQLGDFGLGEGHAGAAFLRKVNKALKGRTLFVVLGNHESYDKLAKTRPHPTYPGATVLNEAPNIAFLNRGTRIKAGGREIVTIGGANSINKDSLAQEDVRHGNYIILKSWWPEEQISDADVASAIMGGPADVMLSHDCPDSGFPMSPAEREASREYWGDEAVNYANQSSLQLEKVYQSVKPKLVLHGHHHRRKTTEVRDSSGVTVFESIAAEDNMDGVVLLTLENLKVERYILHWHNI